MPGAVQGPKSMVTVWFLTYVCDSCGYASLGMLDYRCKPAEGKAADKPRFSSKQSIPAFPVDYEEIANFDFSSDTDAIQWIPTAAVGKEFKDVPEAIASVASEAYSCSLINANMAAVLMARTAIEATAKDKQITDGSLYDKIVAMEEKNIITSQLKAEAHEIRLDGNDMAHGDLAGPVSKEDVADILGFLDSILNYVYQQPKAVQRRKEMREQRKQANKSGQNTDVVA